MTTEQLIAMALNEAGFATEVGTAHIWFWLPNCKHKGRFDISGTNVTCREPDIIKINLYDPTSLQKLATMALKCIGRHEIDGYPCCHCPFKVDKEESAIASFARHTRKREDLY